MIDVLGPEKRRRRTTQENADRAGRCTAYGTVRWNIYARDNAAQSGPYGQSARQTDGPAVC